MKRLICFAVACAAVFSGAVFSARSSPSQRASNRLQEELAKAPANAAERANPFEGQPDAIRAGHKLFQRYCAECHEEANDHPRRGPNLRSPEIQSAAPGALAWYLKNGNLRTGMPSWSRLPEQQRWQIVAYLKSSPK